MRINNLIFAVFTIITILTGCEKNEPNDGLASAKLFYSPSCATINGVVVLDGSNETFVFQHEIEENFRKDEIKVLLAFEKGSDGPLTADCIQAPIIMLTDLRER